MFTVNWPRVDSWGQFIINTSSCMYFQRSLNMSLLCSHCLCYVALLRHNTKIWTTHYAPTVRHCVVGLNHAFMASGNNFNFPSNGDILPFMCWCCWGVWKTRMSPQDLKYDHGNHKWVCVLKKIAWVVFKNWTFSSHWQKLCNCQVDIEITELSCPHALQWNYKVKTEDESSTGTLLEFFFPRWP